MKIKNWTISVELDDERKVNVSDLPDDVAQGVDDYLTELEESGEFDLVCPIPKDKLNIIKKGVELRLEYGTGLNKINGGYAIAEFDESETEIAMDERESEEENIILIFRIECGEQDTGDGGNSNTGQVSVEIDKDYKIINIKDY